MILDSSFLIDIEHEDPGALATARAIEGKGLPRRVPLVVIAELYIGVGTGVRTDENRRGIDAVLRGLPVVRPTRSIAKRAGIIEGELQAKRDGGTGIGIADAFIAATAEAYGEPVVTGDPDDFAMVPGIEVETY